MWNYGLTHPAKTKQESDNNARLLVLATGLMLVILVCVLFWRFVLFGNPQVVQFQVESATVSGLKVNGSMLTGTWDFTLVATNPNQKVTINCNTIDASLFKNYMPYFATNRLPSLFLNSSGHNHVRFKLGLVDHYIDPDDAIEIFEEKARGLVTFQLDLGVDFTYRTKFWDVWDLKDSHLWSSHHCDPVQFGFSPNNDTGVFTGILTQLKLLEVLHGCLT